MLIDTITDNEATFLTNILSAVRHADPEANIDHKRSLNKAIMIISPSKEEFKQDIISNLINLHRTYKLKVTFSKSLAKAKNITFSIDLENYQ